MLGSEEPVLARETAIRGRLSEMVGRIHVSQDTLSSRPMKARESAALRCGNAREETLANARRGIFERRVPQHPDGGSLESALAFGVTDGHVVHNPADGEPGIQFHPAMGKQHL